VLSQFGVGYFIYKAGAFGLSACVPPVLYEAAITAKIVFGESTSIELTFSKGAA